MAVLEVKNLKKCYGKTDVLKGISFSHNKGEVLSIIGSSGSGKTTLLRCINFLEQAEHGQILVNGRLVFDADAQQALTLEQKRQNQLLFGLVFQSFNLFPQYNALENVSLAVSLLAKSRPEFKTDRKRICKQIQEDARTLLARVGLSDKINNYPCELSGGQQQRVAIARALALNPQILCFDEPTSALDPELTGEVLAVIRGLVSENITMIIVTHEMAFAKDVSDRVIFMDDGIIVEEGPPDQLLTAPKTERLRAFLSSVLNR